MASTYANVSRREEKISGHHDTFQLSVSYYELVQVLITISWELNKMWYGTILNVLCCGLAFLFLLRGLVCTLVVNCQMEDGWHIKGRIMPHSHL